MSNVWPEIGFTDGVGDVAEISYTDLYNLKGDNFNIDSVCPYYLPESQSWATWRRDERGVVIVSGYDPEEDERNHWLCHCGNFITHGGRCSCGGEPPWGADDGEDWVDDDLDFGFEFDPYERDDEGDPEEYWLPGDILEYGGWE